MSSVGQKLITAEEFAQMPDPEDGSIQELVEGVIETMPSPQGRHGFVCNRVGRLLGNHADDHDLGWVTNNYTGMLLERDPDSVRGADVAFWSVLRMPEPPEGWPELPPDLAVEVLSPSDRASKTNAKVRQYLRCGVAVVWVIDPESRIVSVYRGKFDQQQNLEETDTLTGDGPLAGFSCRVADLFGKAKP